MNENITLRLVVEGNIQGVGYRALVKHIAMGLKIKGFVKNLHDGTVEVFCEGTKKNVEAFKKKINIKTENRDLFSVNVENINEFQIDCLPRKTEKFEIDYGDEAKNEFEKTNLERLEIGSLILTDLSSKTDKLDSTMDNFRKETNQNFVSLSAKSDKLDSTMDNFRKETNQNFMSMDTKYGDISKQMINVESNISKLLEEFADSNKTNAELVRALVDKLDKVIK